jgi:hypothetical protein
MKLESAMLGNDLPGAYFFTPESLIEFRDEAVRYEQTVADFERYGCEPDLSEGLHDLCFNDAEIEWHVKNRGKRMQRGYM